MPRHTTQVSPQSIQSVATQRFEAEQSTAVGSQVLSGSVSCQRKETVEALREACGGYPTPHQWSRYVSAYEYAARLATRLGAGDGAAQSAEATDAEIEQELSAGQLTADESLINALGPAATRRLFRATNDTAFNAACAQYSRANRAAYAVEARRRGLR